MPIDWESGKDFRASGHPKKCERLPNHSTRKDGKCKIFFRCKSADLVGCVAKGGV